MARPVNAEAAARKYRESSCPVEVNHSVCAGLPSRCRLPRPAQSGTSRASRRTQERAETNPPLPAHRRTAMPGHIGVLAVASGPVWSSSRQRAEPTSGALTELLARSLDGLAYDVLDVVNFDPQGFTDVD